MLLIAQNAFRDIIMTTAKTQSTISALFAFGRGQIEKSSVKLNLTSRAVNSPRVLKRNGSYVLPPMQRLHKVSP